MDRFLDSNPGLAFPVNRTLRFETTCRSSWWRSFSISAAAPVSVARADPQRIARLLRSMVRTERFGNGRTARRFPADDEQHAERVATASPNADDLTIIRPGDLPPAVVGRVNGHHRRVGARSAPPVHPVVGSAAPGGSPLRCLWWVCPPRGGSPLCAACGGGTRRGEGRRSGAWPVGCPSVSRVLPGALVGRCARRREGRGLGSGALVGRCARRGQGWRSRFRPPIRGNHRVARRIGTLRNDRFRVGLAGVV